MMDANNNEENSFNGDADEYKSWDDVVNGDTYAYSFGAENARTNNDSTDNADDDIDATYTDDGDAGSNENCDPNDKDAQHDPYLMSSVVHSCITLYLYAFMGMTLLW